MPNDDSIERTQNKLKQAMNLKFPFYPNKPPMNQKWTTSRLPSEQQVDFKNTPKWNKKRQQKDPLKTQFRLYLQKTKITFHNYVTNLFLATLKTTAVVFQSTILNDAPFVFKATSGLIFILVFVIYESHTKIQKGTYLVLSKYILH